MINLFKKLFSKKEEKIEEQVENINTLATLSQFDDILVKINDDVFEGWVVDKQNNIVNVVYTDFNKKLHTENFKLERPLNRTSIEQNNKTLILK